MQINGTKHAEKPTNPTSMPLNSMIMKEKNF